MGQPMAYLFSCCCFLKNMFVGYKLFKKKLNVTKWMQHITNTVADKPKLFCFLKNGSACCRYSIIDDHRNVDNIGVSRHSITLKRHLHKTTCTTLHLVNMWIEIVKCLACFHELASGIYSEQETTIFP